jgi:hypothetical protein
MFQFSFIILIVLIATGVLGKMLYPIILLLKFIVSLLYSGHYSIIYFLVPSIICVIITVFYYLKFRNDIYKSPVVQETDVKKEIINQYQKTKVENSIYKEILGKIQSKTDLTEAEKDFIKSNEDFKNICGEADFKENDEYCLSCERYKNCIAREMQKIFNEN